MRKKVVNILCWTVCVTFFLVITYFLTAFFGNPISGALAKSSAKRYLKENYAESDFEISRIGYNLKTGGYFAFVESPSSQDSHFTLYFDGWGRYEYDTYDNITSYTTTFSRLHEEYWNLVKSKMPERIGNHDVSIGFGELKISGIIEIYTYMDENGNTVEYTLDKDYGLDRSILELDAEYDIIKLGSDHGCICLYIHDPEVSVDRAAELLLEVKACLDEQGVPFHAIDFSLCEPRNAEGQMVGKQITLYEFLYSDIHEDGLLQRVEASWKITQEHHALQDGLKTKSEYISTEEVIP